VAADWGGARASDCAGGGRGYVCAGALVEEQRGGAGCGAGVFGDIECLGGVTAAGVVSDGRLGTFLFHDKARVRRRYALLVRSTAR